MKYMLKLLFIAVISIIAISCDNTSSKADLEEETPLKPEPLSGLYSVFGMYNDGIYYAGWCHDGIFTPVENSGTENPIVVECVAIDGPNLYIGGGCYDVSLKGYVPGYWVNGEWNPFEAGPYYGQVTEIAADNDNIYGTINGGTGHYLFNKTVYSPIPSFGCSSLDVVENDVYLGGMYNHKPAYMFNDELVLLDLPDDGETYTGLVVSIYVYNSDVYSFGNIQKSEGEYILGYWKNTEWIRINKTYSSGYNGKIAVNSDGVYIAVTDDSELSLWHNNKWTYYCEPYNTETGSFYTIISSLTVCDDILVGVSYIQVLEAAQRFIGAGYYKNGQWIVPDVDCDGEECYEISCAGLVYQ